MYSITYKLGGNTKSDIIDENDYSKWQRAKEQKQKGTEFIKFSFGEIQLGLVLEVVSLEGQTDSSEKIMEEIREYYKKRDLFLAMSPEDKTKEAIGQFKIL